MSTVDEIIENLIAKQDANDALARTDKLNKTELYFHIKQIENKKANQMGNGAFKKVYPFKGDKVILSQLFFSNTLDLMNFIVCSSEVRSEKLFLYAEDSSSKFIWG